MKVFISQPMRDKTNEQIENERSIALSKIQTLYPNEKLEIIDSFFKDAPHEANALWFLGKSIELLSTADIAYFIGDWKHYRGCRIEYQCCCSYGIETIEE